MTLRPRPGIAAVGESDILVLHGLPDDILHVNPA
jgi:hypothetical protein